MKRSYLDYAMSVIVSRALPDVRDGLKPVHRRILYSMHENGYTTGTAPIANRRASSATSWASITRTATSRSTTRWCAWRRTSRMRVPLIDGQGNFGSVDGDPPAADALHRSAPGQGRRMSLLDDLDKDTVDFQDNYDGTRAGADGPAGALPEPAGQRRGRHRRRHGDQHPAAQSGRSDRRLPRLYRRSGDHDRRADRDRAGAGLPDRRPDHRQGRHPRRPIARAAARS